MKKLTLILLLILSFKLFAQGIDKIQLVETSMFIDKSPMEIIKKYNLKLIEHEDNFGKINDYLSGYTLNGELVDIKLVHENDKVQEITIFCNKDYKNFFWKTGEMLASLSQEDKNIYKVSHNISKSQTNYFNSFDLLINGIKESYPLSDYTGWAFFNQLPYKYSMLIVEDSSAIIISKYKNK